MPPVKYFTADDPDVVTEPQPTIEDDLYRFKRVPEAIVRSVSTDMALGRLEQAQ